MADRCTDGDDASGTKTADIRHGLFDISRKVVGATHDDEVFSSSCDPEAASVGNVADVAGAPPSVRGD